MMIARHTRLHFSWLFFLYDAMQAIIESVHAAHSVSILRGSHGCGRTSMVQKAVAQINTNNKRKRDQFVVYVFEEVLPVNKTPLLYSRQVDGSRPVIVIKSYEKSYEKRQKQARMTFESKLLYWNKYKSSSEAAMAKRRNPVFLQITLDEAHYDAGLAQLQTSLNTIDFAPPSIYEKRMAATSMCEGLAIPPEDIPFSAIVLRATNYHSMANDIRSPSTVLHSRDTTSACSLMKCIVRLRCPLTVADRCVESIAAWIEPFDTSVLMTSLQANPTFPSRSSVDMTQLSSFMDTLSEWDTLPYGDTYTASFIRMATMSLGTHRTFRKFVFPPPLSECQEMVRHIQESDSQMTGSLGTPLSLLERYDTARFIHVGNHDLNVVTMNGFHPVGSLCLSEMGTMALNKKLRERLLCFS